jgi:hypothetical protein
LNWLKGGEHVSPSRNILAFALLVLAAGQQALAQKRNYRLPAVDLKQRVIWGATCEGPGDTGLSFGGQDQRAADGRPHTRVRVKGEWQAIHHDLRARNPLQTFHDRCRALAKRQKDVTARARHLYLEGLGAGAEAKRVKAEVLPVQEQVNRELAALAGDLKKAVVALKGYDAEQGRRAGLALKDTLEQLTNVAASLAKPLTSVLVEEMHAAQVALELAAEGLDAEPPARALSPLVFDRRSKCFVLFGGDHLDYLTNDTWIFDPARKKWEQRHPDTAPAPRANHTLKAPGDGKVVLSGGLHLRLQYRLHGRAVP